MNWLRSLIANLGFAPHVAKPSDGLIERADKVIDKVDTLRVEIITKDEREARLRRLDLQAGRRR